MKWFGKKKRDEEFLDLGKESIPELPREPLMPTDNSSTKLDLINARLQNIEAKLERIEWLLNQQPKPQPNNSPIKW